MGPSKSNTKKLKKLIFWGNLVLAAILVFRIGVLYFELAANVEDEIETPSYQLTNINKHKVQFGPAHKAIFGENIEDTNGKPDGDTSVDERAENQWMIQDSILRVQGVFITPENRYAVLTFIPKDSKMSPVIKKVFPGDHIANFSIISIQSGSVTFRTNGAITKRLKIFRPLDDSLKEQ